MGRNRIDPEGAGAAAAAAETQQPTETTTEPAGETPVDAVAPAPAAKKTEKSDRRRTREETLAGEYRGKEVAVTYGGHDSHGDTIGIYVGDNRTEYFEKGKPRTLAGDIAALVIASGKGFTGRIVEPTAAQQK
jgi:hypothetical protein